MLHGRIDHIQTIWVKLGVERTQVMLRGGVNDLGGTLTEETISRMAGSENGTFVHPRASCCERRCAIIAARFARRAFR
jgi:2-iminoacetate synthase ThiH